MADIEKAAVAVTAALPTDMPNISKNADVIASEELHNNTADNNHATIETGTSPTQERSNNSHQHDSEYDTASDLEGAEDYDEEESISDEEDYDESEGEDQANTEGGISLDKSDADAPKKVDEDRRNPQYIPKRGTFYEHDDRESAAAGGAADAKAQKAAPAPATQAPKNTRKWQAPTNSDRWSHDRFDPSEQAPKSRAELVSSYGYDIRNEEAPPRARRRRRYARGPSRYERNWEDENAYMRANNKERRPPRPSDFPALNERAPKPRKSVNARLQRSSMGPEQHADDRSVDSERYERNDNKSTTPKTGKYAGRGNTAVGHQVPMEFKSKQRRNQQEHTHTNRAAETSFERQQPQQQQRSNAVLTSPANETQKFNSTNLTQIAAKQQANNYNKENNYNNNNNSVLPEQTYRVQTTTPAAVPQQQPPTPAQQQQHMQRPVVKGGTPTTSSLQQRLQQVQNRNDPSHVGSVQMHAMAAQNQMQANQQQQQQQQQTGNMLLQQQQNQTPPQQQQQQLTQDQQRGPPKRYSSIRRTQHDAHLTDHQLQQLQQQQQQQQLQQQQQQAAAMMLPPEQQHILAQANLMQQLYHQEMQALQVSQTAAPPPAAVSKPNAYNTVPGAAAGTPQAYPGSSTAAPNVPPAAYYVTAPPPTEVATYTQQTAPPTNYLPPAPYGPAPAATGPPATVYATPPPVAAVASAAAAAPPSSNANQNYPNYQNFNTVGGTTYFVPPAQPSARPVVLPQRRPTNAIPILPPNSTEKNKQQRSASEAKEDTINKQRSSSPCFAPIGSAENIDHIIDNMFVQRPAFQPPRKSSSPPIAEQVEAPATASTEDVSNNEVAQCVEIVNTQVAPSDVNVNVTAADQSQDVQNVNVEATELA